MSNLMTTAEIAALYQRHCKIFVKEFQEELNKPTPEAILDQKRRLIEDEKRLIEDEKRLGKTRRKWEKYFNWKKRRKKLRLKYINSEYSAVW